MKVVENRRLQRLPAYGARLLFLIIIAVLIGGPSTFGQEGGPDVNLRIVGILNLHPPLPDEGDVVQVGILVENYGKKDARDVSVYFYEDDINFEKNTVDITAGDTVYVEAYWTADSGDSYISVRVDPAADFTEDKTDNRTSVWMTVR